MVPTRGEGSSRKKKEVHDSIAKIYQFHEPLDLLVEVAFIGHLFSHHPLYESA